MQLSRVIDARRHSLARLIFLIAALLATATLAALPNDVGSPGDVLAPEALVTVTGKLTVIIGDDPEHDRTEVIYILEDALSKRHYRLHFTGQPGDLKSGDHVTVRGRAVGGELYLAADGDGQNSIEVSGAADPAAQGEQRTLVIVTDFTDASVACSVQSIRDLMFTDPDGYSIDALYREISREQVWFSGDVVGPFAIDYSSSSVCDPGSWANAAEAAATASGLDLAAYPRKVFVMPQQNSCGMAGYGSVGGPETRAWIFPCDGEDFYAHEIGHNLGLGHASTPANEYGDTSDFMGVGSWPLRQTNAPHQERMGWVEAQQVSTVTTGGTYDIAPLELDAAAAGAPQVLKIAKPDTNESYYLSYRMPIGFDANLAYTYLRRLTIHRHSGASPVNRSFLLGTRGDGESFVDDVNGLTFTQTSHSDAGVTVQVAFDGACNPQPPLIAVEPASQSGAPGDTLDYTVAVTNRDGAVCPASTFSLSADLPGGTWTGALSQANLSLQPGQTGQAMLSVSSPANAADGAYTVGVTVSDAGEPLHAASGEAIYEVQEIPPSCTPAPPIVDGSPASQSGAPGNTLDYTVSVTNQDGAVCATSTFTLTADLPGGTWTVALSQSDLSLLPGETGQATLSVTSPPGAANGTNQIELGISDGGDQIHTVSDTVTYIVQSTCSAGIPTVRVSPGSQTASAGVSVPYSLDITNTDATSCGNSTFQLSVTVPPTGWIGTASPSSLSLSPGQTLRAIVWVTSPDTAIAGDYAFHAEAAGPATSASDEGIYTVTGPSILPTVDDGGGSSISLLSLLFVLLASLGGRERRRRPQTGSKEKGPAMIAGP